MATAKREPLPACHEVHEVRISFNEGRFDYGREGNPVHARQGDCIRWSSDRSFAVHFQGISPFDKVDFSGNDGENTGEVTKTAPSGTYKYIVAVMDEGKRIHIDDPHVIVP